MKRTNRSLYLQEKRLKKLKSALMEGKISGAEGIEQLVLWGYSDARARAVVYGWRNEKEAQKI